MSGTNRLGALVLAVVLFALAACDSVTVTRSRAVSSYTGGFFVQTVAANGTNAVVVRNSPFPPQTVVEALRARYQGNQYRFALAPAGGDWNGYTLIVGFGEPPVGGQNQCENPGLPLPPAAPGRTVVTADYCSGNRPLTEVVGRAPALAGPNDPRLRELIGGVVAELFLNTAP